MDRKRVHSRPALYFVNVADVHKTAELLDFSLFLSPILRVHNPVSTHNSLSSQRPRAEAALRSPLHQRILP